MPVDGAPTVGSQPGLQGQVHGRW
jgi:hypothetical protein